ncbi:serine/threonine-protein kinase [Roseiconus lacunae]|uniref:serine/threonine protein kinase n=1 Tax=Roseiconus lacunae TaxID=2605694 RepID=UPI003087CDFF|nr:serine/threonine-protein kinase [Stieleria sp. HD01]
MSGTATQHDFLDPPQDGSGDLGTLAHYRVIRELGKGGMGYVFLAEDNKLKRQVALKVMNQKIAATPGSRKRFISEARTMAAVHHDNVATIFEVGEYKGTPFMAMELLEGSTLEDYRETHGEPDFHRIIDFARDMARGLAAAHQRGIVHRDIKPANIWLDTKTNRIKILDFGLALAQTPVDQLSGRGAVVGTPGYLSPEQARSEPLDDRSDLYSTGVVLYELATGKLPLKSKSVAEQLIAILAHHPVPVRERNDKIPQPLAELIEKLMAKEPRDRYDDARQLEASLDDVEKECESKSEMAQAISQLQAGLEQAVSKKQSDVPAANESTPNPFEALPDSLPPASIAAASLPVGASASGSGANPVFAAATPPAPSAAVASAASQASKAGRAKSGAGLSTSQIVMIAVAAVAVLLLITIPLVVYFTASSAIARQQDATVVTETADGNAAANSQPRSTNASAKHKAAPTEKPKAQSKDQPGNRAGSKAGNAKLGGGPSAGAKPKTNAKTFASISVTKVSPSDVQSLGGKGVRYLINDNNGNGSFEQGNASAAGEIPGWKIERIGSSGGWLKNGKAREIDGNVYAFAGKRSEVILTSQPADYRANTGDRFRVGLHVGGEGKGVSDFLVVLGFVDDQGKETHFELDRLSSGNAWSAPQPKRLRYEYEIDNSVAGQRPFVQVGISNLNRVRDLGVADRVILTVLPVSKPAEPARAKPSAEPTAKPMQTPESKSDTASDADLRIVTITTKDELGADTTVRRGGSVNDPLGEKLNLVIQTRNDRQIQHIYLRFPLASIGGGQAGQQRSGRPRNRQQENNRLPVKKAAVRLSLIEPVEDEATVQLFGLNDPVSDIWPEGKIVWSNSISAAGLDELPKLGSATVTPTTREIVISDPALAEFLAANQNKTATLILTGSRGNEQVSLASKEDSSRDPPRLVLGLDR